MFYRRKSANKPLHVSYAAVRSFSIRLPHNGVLLYHGLLPAVRQRQSHVNGGVSALCRAKRVAQSGVENNSLDDSATHNPDNRAGVGRIRARNNGAWNDAMSLVMMH